MIIGQQPDKRTGSVALCVMTTYAAFALRGCVHGEPSSNYMSVHSIVQVRLQIAGRGMVGRQQ